MENKHTSGPWKVYNNVGRKGEIGVIAEAAPCVIASGFSEKYWPGIARANAELIAAAPEMLAALEECITDKGAYCMGRGIEDLKRRIEAINAIAQKAIAKAKGV